MMKPHNDEPIFDDEFNTSAGNPEASVSYFRSYIRAKELARNAPSKRYADVKSEEFGRFFKEIHSQGRSRSTLFRRKSDAPSALSTTWLAAVRDIARTLCIFNNTPEFRGISREQMLSLAKLNVSVKNLKKLQELFFELGIILIYERSLPGMKLDGAVFKLENGTPVIALSLRYSRLDIFWFSLMHEVAHIHLHYEQLSTPILDNLDEEDESEIEAAANYEASNALISRADWRSCDARYSPKEEFVIEFANRIGTHPAIVAGRLQRELNKHTLFTRIVNEINVRKILIDEE